MLRLIYKSSVALAALALLASAPSIAQQGGLAGKLADASKQLQSDVQMCKPINLGEYQALLNEAAKNKQRAERAAKKGVPVDMKQIDADLAAASALFNQATGALVQQCMRAAQKAPKTTGALPGGALPKGDYSNASVGDNSPVENPADVNTIYQGAIGTGVNCAPGYECRKPTETQTREQVGNVPAVKLNQWDQRILEVHNVERAAVGAPPLEWTSQLASDASAWATQLARTGQLIHAPREGRGIERENLSEGNLWWTTDQMMNNWIGEKRYFHPGIFPNVCSSGDWSQCAHYSQMIWPTTTDLGCGEASGSGHKWLVCRYAPGGNRDGKPVGINLAMNSAPRPTINPVIGLDTLGNQPNKPPKMSILIDIINGERQRLGLPLLNEDGSLAGQAAADAQKVADTGIVPDPGSSLFVIAPPGTLTPQTLARIGIDFRPKIALAPETKKGSCLMQEAWFREALILGIDRKALVKTFYGQIAPGLGVQNSLIFYQTDGHYVGHFKKWAAAAPSGGEGGSTDGGKGAGKAGYLNKWTIGACRFSTNAIKLAPNKAPAAQAPTAVEPPKLPDKEVFKPPEPKPGEIDPM